MTLSTTFLQQSVKQQLMFPWFLLDTCLVWFPLLLLPTVFGCEAALEVQMLVRILTTADYTLLQLLDYMDCMTYMVYKSRSPEVFETCSYASSEHLCPDQCSTVLVGGRRGPADTAADTEKLGNS